MSPSTATAPTQPSLTVPSDPQSGDSVPPPLSPITPQGTFPHKTVSAAPTQPFIDTSTPAINAAPVELDGTPTTAPAEPPAQTVHTLSEKDVQEKAQDPAVLMNIPLTPGAVELAVVDKAAAARVEKGEGEEGA